MMAAGQGYGGAESHLEDLARAVADDGGTDRVQDVGREWPICPGVALPRVLEQLLPHPRQPLHRAVVHRNEVGALREVAHHHLR